MVQRHPEVTEPAPVAGHPPPLPTGTGGELLAVHLQAWATEFLRALRTVREQPDTAPRALRRSARRIGGLLHTFRPLLDRDWADGLRGELAWLSTTLAREHACADRLDRLLTALTRLSGTPEAPAAVRPSDRTPPDGHTAAGALTLGTAKAGALLERRLTLARTRAHSAALGALGSSRFHGVADRVAVLASEVPLTPGAVRQDLGPLAADAAARLTDAVAALPMPRTPYPSDGLTQDAPWHHVRLLLRLHRCTRDVLYGDGTGDPRLAAAGRALDRHRDAAEAAADAASAARTPRIAPATAYALGVLTADQRHEVEAARYEFCQLWRTGPVSTP
ncbi:CHAD domain-containing protein [Streptomyces sp. NPDC058045]|uniref:CHAD domain-containing protein n=1 Tax=Streptomyces sp. NPDC058045 TaxID=3346311 RepID=UPI0036E4532B